MIKKQLLVLLLLFFVGSKLIGRSKKLKKDSKEYKELAPIKKDHDDPEYEWAVDFLKSKGAPEEVIKELSDPNTLSLALGNVYVTSLEGGKMKEKHFDVLLKNFTGIIDMIQSMVEDETDSEEIRDEVVSLIKNALWEEHELEEGVDYKIGDMAIGWA